MIENSPGDAPVNFQPPESDDWSNWLLCHRHAGDAEYARNVRESTRKLADRVVDGANLRSGMTLADIGSGDGLVAFRAIDRMGATLRCILTDISAPMLRYAEKEAKARGFGSQCDFLLCSADELGAIENNSVDAVTTRAVLAYVADKPAALAEFHRILRPGGRISIAEPVLRDEALATLSLKRTLEAQANDQRDRFMVLCHRWKAAQFPDTEERIAASAITNYSERDLLRWVQDAGFTQVHMEMHFDMMTSDITSWDVFVGIAPHPWAPTLKSILQSKFSAAERSLFESIVRPQIESGRSVSVGRGLYLTADKPVPDGFKSCQESHT